MSGSRRAVAAGWLLVAMTACGSRPDGLLDAAAPPRARREPRTAPSARPSAIRFEERAAQLGLVFRHEAGRSDHRWLPEIMGAGIVVFDADGDGREDVLALNGRRWPDARPDAGAEPSSRLFRSTAGGFVDSTDGSGLALVAQTMGGAAFDIDADGDRDVVVATLEGLRLFVNDGRGRFTDETAARGADVSGWTSVVAPFDADGDGDVDLFVGRYVLWSTALEAEVDCRVDGVRRDYCSPNLFRGTTPVLLRNDGRGRFSDASAAAGLPRDATKALGVLASDLDGDHRVDLIVANDQMRTQVLLAQPDGRFLERAAELGLAGTEGGHPYSGMGIDATWNAPGGLGLCVAIGNFTGEPVTLHCRRDASSPFLERSQQIGIRRATLRWVSFGLRFVDLDLDGDEDFVLANGHVVDEESVRGTPFRQPLQVFEAEGNELREVSQTALTNRARDPMLGRAIATLDLDRDGDLDVLVSDNGGPLRALVNVTERAGAHWIALRLEGAAPNVDALGASVVLRSGARAWTRSVHATGSYYAQSSLDVHVGLGGSSASVSAEVRWPSGRVQHIDGLAVDRRHVVREDTSLARADASSPVPVRASAMVLLDRALAADDLTTAQTIIDREVASSPDDPDLLRELSIVRWRRGDHAGARAAAVRAASTIGHPQGIHTHLLRVYQQRRMPELAEAMLVEATRRHPDEGALWNELGVLLRPRDPESARRAFERALSARHADSSARVNLAQVHIDRREHARARELLEEVVAADPRDSVAWQLLGVARYSQGQRDSAEQAWRRAVQADDRNGEAHYNLGQLAIEQRRPLDALAPLLRASELRPQDHRVWGNLGIALQALGRIDDARSAYRRALAIRPDDEQARAALRALGP